MVVGWQFPGHVVIRLAASLRKILRDKQVDGVVAVGLVEPNDVCASGIISFLQS
jgi:hypothetical protein